MISQLQEEVVQGPLEHPQHGKCLVVRPTIGTARAGRFPTQAVVITSAARRFITLSKDGEKLKSIVVEAAEEDPTIHPEFHEISRNLRELTNKWFPKANLCLLSDRPELSRPQVRHALGFYDQPILRLEAGTQKTFAALGGNSSEFKDIVTYMGRLELERLIVYADFVRGDVDNSQDNEIKAWIRHLGVIKPAGVHISTPRKAEGKTKPVTKTRMGQIADMVTEKTGIPVEVSGV